MGQSRRKDKVRCSKCLKRYYLPWSLGKRNKSWDRVKFIKMMGNGFLLECLNCSHQWVSYSPSAHRQFNKHKQEWLKENNL